MSELEELLEKLWREVAGDSDVLPLYKDDFLAVLRRRLLPLLEAGEATANGLDISQARLKQRYDAAKQAALEGK